MSPPAPWSRRTEFAATTAFWLLLTTLLLVRRTLGPMGFVALTPAGVVGTVAEYAVWIAVTPLVFALVRRLPLERGHLGQRIVLHLAIGLAVAAAIEMCRTALLGGLVDAGMLEIPRGRFGGGGRGGPRGPLDAVLQLRFIDEFVIYAGVLAAGVARSSAVRALDRESEAVRLEAERARLDEQLTEARLAALRMQLNPHFLFNALNTVSAFIERDPERAQTMVAQLAALLRRVLDGDARPEVPLADEMALLRDYLAIQQARFGDALTVSEHIDADVLGALVPALVLQPLAENAVEHGVSRLVGEPGRVEIGARREPDGRLVLTVTDNGPGPAAAGTVHGTGVGLANTRDRLEALYGASASLALGDAPEGGAVATVTLPFHTAAPLVDA